MKRPRTDDVSDDAPDADPTDAGNGVDSSDDDAPAPAPAPSPTETGPAPAKRPRPPPKLIIFDWTAEDWNGADGVPGAPTAADADADARRDKDTYIDTDVGGGVGNANAATDAAFHDIVNLLFDGPPATHEMGTQTDADEGCAPGGSTTVPRTASPAAPTSPPLPPPSPPSPPPPPPPQTFCVIDRDVRTLDDLIAVGQLKDDPDYPTKKYSVNVDGLHAMIPALREFQEMIGLDAIKRQVVDQVVYLSGKDNHQQFAALAAEADAKASAERARATSADKSACNGAGNRAGNRSSSLLAQLFDGLSNDRKPKGAGSQYRMSESVTHDDVSCDMFHTVIYGPPGVGKTVFAKLLARLFLNLGVTQNDTFRVARRSDLVGEYVGHTATKTQKVIDEAMGGVLFIDEVYALGNGGSTSGVGDGRVDSFSNECINTLNQNLTERKGEFICIVAGYKKETEKYFFDLNPGLKRRFSFGYNIEPYSWEELTRILMYKIDKLVGWSHAAGLGDQLLGGGFLRDKLKYFPHYAGDVETWLLNVKIAHCKRVFGKAAEAQRVLTRADVEAGYQRYLDQRFNNDEQRELEEAMIRNLYS